MRRNAVWLDQQAHKSLIYSSPLLAKRNYLHSSQILRKVMLWSTCPDSEMLIRWVYVLTHKAPRPEHRPRIWQPVGYGGQPLYELRVRALDLPSNVITRQVGIRHVELMQVCAGEIGCRREVYL